MWTLCVWEQCQSNIFSGHVSYAGNCCAFDWSNKCCWTRSQWTCKVKVFFVRPCLLSRPFLSPLHSHQRQLLPLKLPPLASRQQLKQQENEVCKPGLFCRPFLSPLHYITPAYIPKRDNHLVDIPIEMIDNHFTSSISSTARTARDRSFPRYITLLQLTFPSETIIATSSISSTFPSRWLIIISPLASRQQPGQQENGVNRGEATETKARGWLSGSSPDLFWFLNCSPAFLNFFMVTWIFLICQCSTTFLNKIMFTCMF